MELLKFLFFPVGIPMFVAGISLVLATVVHFSKQRSLAWAALSEEQRVQLYPLTQSKIVRRLGRLFLFAIIAESWIAKWKVSFSAGIEILAFLFFASVLFYWVLRSIWLLRRPTEVSVAVTRLILITALGSGMLLLLLMLALSRA